ncbi:Uma2 family endonuclease [Aerosakkonema sp. BLCC-F183]|uniref:Uma2 family endonuclease n=1 Tax=Aerosakkonema sp. BLCC-F183 TaxID=3342834 RepID=UPI0035B6DDAC
MTISTTKPLTFEEFLQVCPEDGNYELIDGEIIKMEATGAHKNVARFLLFAFNDEIKRLKLDWVVDKDIVIRTFSNEGTERGRRPDVSLVEGRIWDRYLNTYAAITEPLILAVEVASSNWDDDYIDKVDEYQRLGIPEYWIVDYLAVASRNYLGNPKVPTVSVYHLIEGVYQVKRYTGNDLIISPTFPELQLTVATVVAASRSRNMFDGG